MAGKERQTNVFRRTSASGLISTICAWNGRSTCLLRASFVDLRKRMLRFMIPFPCQEYNDVALGSLAGINSLNFFFPITRRRLEFRVCDACWGGGLRRMDRTFATSLCTIGRSLRCACACSAPFPAPLHA